MKILKSFSEQRFEDSRGQNVIKFERKIRKRRVKVVVSVQILKVVVEHNEHFSPAFGDPMDTTVDTHGFRIVVVLNQVRPRELGCKNRIETDAS